VVTAKGRATRLPLEIEIEYRFTSRGAWRASRTINVSRSGVLFRTERPPRIGAVIEFVLRLRRVAAASEMTDLRCQGRLVRAEDGSNGQWSAAATIERYEQAAHPRWPPVRAGDFQPVDRDNRL
jgi:hypothetical protein